MGDQVMNPNPTYAHNLFGTITGLIHNPDEYSNKEYEITIVYEDQSTVVDFILDLYSIKKVATTKECHQFDSKIICKKDQVVISNEQGLFEVEVVTIAPLSDGVYSWLIYGKTSSGEIKMGSMLGFNAGPVPGFTSNQFGESISNPYGSQDIITGYSPASRVYEVYHGELEGSRGLTRAQLAFRLSGKTSESISLISSLYESWQKKPSADNRELKSLVTQRLLKKCQTLFQQETATLNQIEIAFNELKIKKEYGTYQIEGNYLASAVCSHR